MCKIVVTGLGFISSIGNSQEEVLSSLKELKTGIEVFPEFQDPKIPVKLLGTVKGFEFPSPDPEDWEYPSSYSLSRTDLKPMAPNCLFGYCAMRQAITDAGLAPDLVGSERSGLMTAHGGSPYIQYDFLTVMEKRGVNRVRPMSLVGGIIGSLYITLATSFKIRGAALGFNSACASSAHAIGYACDQIRLGRLDRVFVVGGEDPMKFTALPFAAARALSTADDPSRYPCAFDKNRDGFVPTGGAVAMVVESLESAQARGAPIQAEILGWADSADGYNVMAPEPNGEGLARAMRSALRETGVQLGEVDYINAHATGTPSGDTAELRAVKAVFDRGYVPMISSTKSLTGHGLSMAGVLEGAIATMALRDGFIPVSANIRELDPEAEGVPVVTERVDKSARIALSNSSGFGGSNVVLVFKKWEE